MRPSTMLVAGAVVAAAAGCNEEAPFPPQEPVPPPPRAGQIVPQAGIDRLALGMSDRDVRRVYGRPDSVKHLSESENGAPVLDWIYRRRGVIAEFRQTGARTFVLEGVSTTNPAYRTDDGAGVGSTEDDVKHAVDDVECAPADPGERWCTVEGEVIGAPQTVFVLRDGRVTEVRVLHTFP